MASFNRRPQTPPQQNRHTQAIDWAASPWKLNELPKGTWGTQQAMYKSYYYWNADGSHYNCDGSPGYSNATGRAIYISPTSERFYTPSKVPGDEEGEHFLGVDWRTGDERFYWIDGNGEIVRSMRKRMRELGLAPVRRYIGFDTDTAKYRLVDKNGFSLDDAAPYIKDEGDDHGNGGDNNNGDVGPGGARARARAPSPECHVKVEDSYRKSSPPFNAVNPKSERKLVASRRPLVPKAPTVKSAAIHLKSHDIQYPVLPVEAKAQESWDSIVARTIARVNNEAIVQTRGSHRLRIVPTEPKAEVVVKSEGCVVEVVDLYSSD